MDFPAVFPGRSVRRSSERPVAVYGSQHRGPRAGTGNSYYDNNIEQCGSLPGPGLRRCLCVLGIGGPRRRRRPVLLRCAIYVQRPSRKRTRASERTNARAAAAADDRATLGSRLAPSVRPSVRTTPRTAVHFCSPETREAYSSRTLRTSRDLATAQSVTQIHN